MWSTKVGRGLGILVNWLEAPLRCKFGDHEAVKTVEVGSSILKVTCLRCQWESVGITIRARSDNAST